MAELEAKKLLHTFWDRLEEIQVETTQKDTKRVFQVQVNTLCKILYEGETKAIIEVGD